MRAEGRVQAASVVEVVAAAFTEEEGAEGPAPAAPVEAVQEAAAAIARIAGRRFEVGREAESPCSFPDLKRLPEQLQAELHLACRCGSTGDCPRRAGNTGGSEYDQIWRVEIGAV